MAEDLTLKFDIDSGPAVAGVARVERAVEELSGELKTQLEPAAKAVDTAFANLAKAEGPRALQKGILDAERAMKQMKVAADAAAAAGLKIPAGISAALRTGQADVDRYTKKLGQVRDQMGDIKTRADAMAQGFQQAASAGGSLNSMLSNLEARGGVAGTFAQIGLAAGGIATAFGVGMAAGKQLDEFLKSFGINLGKSALDIASWAGAFSKAMEKTGTDPRLIKWLKDLGDAQKDYSNLLVPLVGRQNEAIKSHQALGRAIEDNNRVLRSLGLEWHTAGEAYDRVVKQIEAVSDRMDVAIKSGENFDGIAKANAKTLNTLEAAMKDAGVSVDSLDKDMQTLLATHNALQGKSADLAAATEAEAAAMRDLAIATREANAAFQEQESAIQERNKSIDAATQATGDFTAAQKNGIVFQGEASAVYLQGAIATDAQWASLIRLLEAQNSYNDTLKQTLEVATGWGDYTAQLVDAYQTGALGLLEYKRALQDFQTQLQQTFVGATGEARKSLEAMIATIRKLIETAGQGGTPSGDFSASGALNRMFNP